MVKRFFKKKYFRRKKNVRRAHGRYKARMSHGINRVWSFNQKKVWPVIQSGSSTVNTYAYVFSFNDIPQSGNFGALYDQYRITYIKFKIIAIANTTSVLESYNNTNLGLPYLYYIIDRDDASPPASIDVLREYAKARMFAFTPEKRVCYIGFKPNTLSAAYESAIATSYNLQFSKWVDMAYLNEKYYGIKFGIILPSTASAGVQTAQFYIESTYYFQCKDLR